MRNEFRLDEDFTLELDARDSLAMYKDRFYPIQFEENDTKKNAIYMDGNSLGLMSYDAESTLLRVMDEWKKLGIRGWSGAEVPWIG